MKGTVSAQKALQGSEAETRELLGGTKENSEESLITKSFMKRKQKKIELVPDLVHFEKKADFKIVRATFLSA